MTGGKLPKITQNTADVAENQIEQAKILAANQDMDIEFYTCSAEDIEYPENTFDVITACQCIWYLNHKIAKLSEELILKYNPDWNGCNDYRHDVWVPFTRETWQGRMKACRGVDASMNPEIIAKWEEEHTQMMLKEAPENFNILHYVSYAELKVKM